MSELRDTGDRYEMDEEGLTSYADYRRTGERMYIDYVFSPVPLRGTGASGRLMAALAAEIAEGGDAYSPGVRDVARRLAEDLDSRVQTLEAIVART